MFGRLRDKLKKYSVSVRYSIMFRLMKHLTPVMYDKFIILNNIWSSYHHISGVLDTVNKTPRPAVLFMREYFRGRRVSGLELGVKLGKNSISILKELNIQTLYLVDAWTDYIANEITTEIQRHHYLMTLRKFQNNNRVKILKGLSEVIVRDFDDNSLDFVYIDGNHGFDFVYQDLNVWSKKVRNGGIIAGHDIFNFIHVLSAVKKWCIKNQYNFFIIPPDYYIIKRDIITCKECGYYNREIHVCVHEGFDNRLSRNPNICVCFMPIMDYSERVKGRI